MPGGPAASRSQRAPQPGGRQAASRGVFPVAWLLTPHRKITDQPGAEQLTHMPGCADHSSYKERSQRLDPDTQLWAEKDERL